MRPILAFNWKMNPQTEEEAARLAAASDETGVIVFPPFPLIHVVRNQLTKAMLGAQDVSAADGGAHTGEVSPEMLKALNVSSVIVGHSERRKLGEDDALVASKALQAARQGISPLLCVGESEAERSDGLEVEVVTRQLKTVFDLLGREGLGSRLMVAYEPIWAIGTGENDAPEDANRVAEIILKVAEGFNLFPRVLYGGSVTSATAGRYIGKHSTLSGFLVGGASLKPEEVRNMITEFLL